MKRFLSLVLSLVMVMSLVTVSAGAKDFTDNDTIAYDEAVAVVSEVGIVDGYADGTFKPTNTLTRQAAAKIICNLILGPTTAAELHADTAPYPDVPTTSEFAGYIAFCQSRKIISGYADGNFKPGNTLTGYAFMKMLLGALGYDASLEGYTGGNWSINVAKQALGIGLDDGLEVRDEAVFNGLKAVTREEACLYAFNTLQADLVEYGQRLTTNINGTEVTLSSGGAQSRKWNSQQSRYENIRNDNIIQFAEEYFNKLVKRDDTDKFNRPANTWLYDKVEIGTWTDFTLLVERYTEAITGEDVYDLLGSAAIKDNTLLDFVDGADNSITKELLVRANKKDLPATGNGVLTEIFLDTDTDELTISCINTWLAQATDDYNETKEYAPVEVFTGKGLSKVYNVDVEDVKNVVDVEDEEFYLVNISKKDGGDDVVILSNVEIMEDSTVSKFSAANQGNGTSRVTKLTTGGTEYKNNVQAWYDEDILNEYDDQLLTDNTYNVFLDQYGYFIGVDLFEGTKNYVFITGFDRSKSNISVKTADATGIFLDGTMDTFKVNVTDTDDNIENMKFEENARYFHKWNDSAAWKTAKGNYDGGVYNVNQWYTYTENNGTYTLKPCARMTWTKYPIDAETEVTLKTNKLDVKDTEGNETRVYGNEETTFITVELDNVDTTAGSKRAIADVSGVYTGAQESSIEVDLKDPVAKAEGQVYTVYDRDYFVIGAVVIGEGNGGNANYAYILEGPKSEEKIDDTYYWEFDAIVGGEIKTLTAKSKFSNTINPVKREQTAGNGQPYDGLVELRFDGDYVINIKDVTDVYYAVNTKINDEDFYDVYSYGSQFNTIGNMLELNLKGRTLYITPDQSDVGLALTADCKAVVIQDENGKTDVKTEFTSVKSAIARLAEPKNQENTDGIQYEGRIVAALDSDGAATWILFDNDNELITGKPAEGTGDANEGVVADQVIVNRNGDVSFNLTVKNRPEWIPDDATADVDVSVYRNGVYAAGGTYTGLDADGKPDRINSATSGFGALAACAYDEDNITVEIDDVRYSHVKIRYVDGDGNDVPMVAANTDTKMIVAPGTAATFKLDVSTSKYTTDAATFTITHTKESQNAGDGNITPGTPIANTTGSYSAKDDSDYVYVTFSGLKEKAVAYVIKAAASLSAAKAPAVKQTGATATALSVFGVKGATNDKLAITWDAASYADKTLATITATVTQGATIDAVAYDITIETTAGTYTLRNVSATATQDVRMTADVEIKDVYAVASIKKLTGVVAEINADGTEMTLSYNVGVNGSGDGTTTPKDAVIASDLTLTLGGGNTATVKHTAGDNTITLVFKAPLAGSDTIATKTSIVNANGASDTAAVETVTVTLKDGVYTLSIA